MKNWIFILSLYILYGFSSHSQNPSTNLSKDEGDLLWYYYTDYWKSSEPAMDSLGNIYFIGYKTSGVPESTLYCFDETGNSLWSIILNERIEANPLIIPLSEKIILGSSSSGKLYCLNPDGSICWIYDSGGSITQSAAIDTSENIFFASQANLYSLSTNGTFRWDYNSSYGDITSPISVSQEGNIYFGTEFSKLIALQNTGNEIFISDLFDHVRGEPTIDTNGIIYMATSSVELNQSKIEAFNPDGSLAWDMTFNVPNPSAVIIGDSNFLYLRTINFFGGGYGILYKINKSSHTIVWQFYYSGTAGCSSTPSVAIDGTCYFSTAGFNGGNGRFYAINPDGTIKWQLDPYQLGLDCSPLGSMLIGRNGNIFTYGMNFNYDGCYFIAIEEPSAQIANSPWPMYRHDQFFTGLAENIVLPQPNINLSSQLIDFGYVELGGQKTDTLCIKNTGEVDLIIDWTLESDVFFVDEIISKKTTNNKLIDTIAPSDSLFMVILFIPDDIALFFDTLIFNTNDPDQPVVNVLLKGKSSIEGDIKWKIKLSNLLSGPAIDDYGTCYISGSKIWAIDSNGEIKWEYDPPPSLYRRDYENITISADNRFLYFPKGRKVIALDSSGVEQWIYDPPANDWVTTLSTNSDGHIFFGDEAMFGGGYVYCLDQDGNELWNYFTDRTMYLPPAIDEQNNIYIGGALGSYGKLFSLNDQGSPNWYHHFYCNGGPIIGNNNTIYMGGSYKIGASGYSAVRAIDNLGNILWTCDLDDYFWVSTSLVIGNNGEIYFITRDSYHGNGMIYALNPEGNILWTKLFNNEIISTPAIAKNGAINFGCNDGNFYVLNSDGTERWVIETEASITSSPAIDKTGIIYFVNEDDYLYAVYGENGGLAVSPWPMLQHDAKHTSCIDTLLTSIPEIYENIENQLILNIYPNPVRNNSILYYSLPFKSSVEIKLFDMKGITISQWYFSEQKAGTYTIHWDCNKDTGMKMKSGLYFCMLKTDYEIRSIKIIIN